jgi:hypothetical protein
VLARCSWKLSGEFEHKLTPSSYTSDAENHAKKVDGVASYVHDGEGQRVRKLTGENLLMVYGITGELLANTC